MTQTKSILQTQIFMTYKYNNSLEVVFNKMNITLIVDSSKGA